MFAVTGQKQPWLAEQRDLREAGRVVGAQIPVLGQQPIRAFWLHGGLEEWHLWFLT